MYIYTYTHIIHICIGVYMYVYIYIHPYIHIYIYIHLCTYFACFRLLICLYPINVKTTEPIVHKGIEPLPQTRIFKTQFL